MTRARSRANNEMSVYYDPSGKGSWKAAVTIPGSGGKRKIRRGATRAAAHEKGLELLGQIRSGTLPMDERLTLKLWAERWLDEKRLSVRASTSRDYEMVMRAHVLPAIGGVRLSRLSTAHIQSLYTRMTSAGLSPVSVKDYAARLNACLERAVELDLLVKNPAKKAQLPRQPKREMAMLTAEQAKSLIRATEGDRLEALLVLAITTGARQGELLGLTWDRVENEKAEKWNPADKTQSPAQIRITKTLQAVPGGDFSLEEPKTASSVRRVELPSQAAEALKRHRSRQAAEQLEAKVWLNNRDLVFVSEVGSPIHKTNLTRRVFRPWLAKASLPAMRWHDLRHVAASLMLGKKGVPVTIVAAMLGHADVAITLSTYAHVIPGQQSLAREAMEELLA